MKSVMLISFCSVIFLSLQYHLWWSDDGIIPLFSLSRQIRDQQQINRVLSTYNEQLAQEIAWWKESLWPTENRARHELGMIKKGERFYRFIK